MVSQTVPSSPHNPVSSLLYLGFTGTNLSVDGTATITPNGLLELTNGMANHKGHTFYPTPLHFCMSPNGKVQSFSVTFVSGIRSNYLDITQHGLPFVVAPSKNFLDALANQYLGLTNTLKNGNPTNHSFAVELDTCLNIEFKDIDANRAGININGLNSIKSYYKSYHDDRSGSFQNLSLNSGEAMQVWVDYSAKAKQMNMTMDPLEMEKHIRPLISVSYDLSTIDISKLPKLPTKAKKSWSKLLESILPMATAAFIIIMGASIFLLMRRKLRYTELKEDWEVEFGPHRFSYKDLYQATEGFKSKNLLGVGGFGKVYKGVLPLSKLEVTVKRFVSIGCIRHRSLVQLFGYCRLKGELLLVYDYMSNGSLDKYLYYDESKPTLNWDQRFWIVKGIALGLLYLPESWEKVVIHRDIKASNVLLNNEMNGCLCDFGLARLYDHVMDLQTTHVVGTMGYLAPELVSTGKASPLTDVFAFGMFLLEVTCGRRPNWHRGSLTDTIDTRIQGEYNADEACLVLKLGLLCSHPFSNVGPNMQQVIQYLDYDLPLPEMNHADMSYNMLSLMQDQEFGPYTVSSSIGSISGIFGGR
ncbi:hypothetical protein BS78_02G027400 [Paspalum vaginatum]|nr:hypothetical protein BS78_02G027400 [Paspalum vaginatum]